MWRITFDSSSGYAQIDMNTEDAVSAGIEFRKLAETEEFKKEFGNLCDIKGVKRI